MPRIAYINNGNDRVETYIGSRQCVTYTLQPVETPRGWNHDSIIRKSSVSGAKSWHNVTEIVHEAQQQNLHTPQLPGQISSCLSTTDSEALQSVN